MIPQCATLTGHYDETYEQIHLVKVRLCPDCFEPPFARGYFDIAGRWPVRCHKCDSILWRGECFSVSADLFCILLYAASFDKVHRVQSYPGPDGQSSIQRD